MKPLRQFLLKIGGRQITHLFILLRLQDPMKLYVLLFGSPGSYRKCPPYRSGSCIAHSCYVNLQEKNPSLERYITSLYVLLVL